MFNDAFFQLFCLRSIVMLHSDVVSWYLHPGRAKAWPSLRCNQRQNSWIHKRSITNHSPPSTVSACHSAPAFQLSQFPNSQPVPLAVAISCQRICNAREKVLLMLVWAEGFSPSALCWFASNSSESGKQAVGQNMAWHDRAGLQAPHAWMNALNSGSYIPSIQLCTRTQMQRLPNRYVRIPSKVDTYFLSRPTLHAHMISHDMTGRSIQKFSINYPWLLGASQKFMSAQLQVKIYAWANLLRLMHTVSASMTFLSSTFQSNRISARIDSCLATVSFRKIFRARNYRDTHIQFWSPLVLLRITFSRNTEFGQDSLQPLPSFAEACSLILSWERLLWPPGETLQVTPRNNQDKLDNWTKLSRGMKCSAMLGSCLVVLHHGQHPLQ